MSIDILQTLSALNEFFSEEVLPALPKAMRGEMRAAIKNISDVMAELPSLNSRLAAQNKELQALFNDTLCALDISTQAHVKEDKDLSLALEFDPGLMGDLGTLQHQHLVLKSIVTTALINLQDKAFQIPQGSVSQQTSDVDNALRLSFELLGKHTSELSAFQSVFPIADRATAEQ